MYWSTQRSSVPLTELGWINTTYLASGFSQCDPMMVWGTTFETDALDALLVEQRRATGMIISPAHVLVKAVAESLHRHSEVNRRVFGHRVHQYNSVNITMPMLQTSTGEVDSVFLHEADRMSLVQIARRFWEEARTKALHVAAERRRRREASRLKNLLFDVWRRLSLGVIHAGARLTFALGNRLRGPTIFAFQHELNGAGAFVNYLGFPDAPPMVSHKPASLPMNSYSVAVTLGRAEPRAVVVDNAIVIRKQASLFVRADHRMVNGHQMAAFISTLRNLLLDPQSLADSPERTSEPTGRRAA
jgi:hypothetical protein